MEKGGRGNKGETTVSEIDVLLPHENHVQYGGVSTVSAPPNDRGPFRNAWDVISSLTIEPVMFAFMFGYFSTMSVLPNMIMDKGCLFLYHYPPDVCDNITAHKTEKDRVEQLAADYAVYGNLLSFLAAFLMIFIAPWSDKYSRKLPLLLAVFGAFLTDVGFVYCTLYYDSDLLYVILSRLPYEMSGGLICVFTIIFSLVSELSTPQNRSLKYTTVEVAFGVGMALGGLAGGYVYKYFGYLYVYATSALFHFSACLWVVFFVQETRGLGTEASWRQKAGDFFTLTSISESVSATCRKRPGRGLLLLLMLCMCLVVLNYESFGTVAYVYVHHVFNWDPTTYSLVTTISMLVNFTSTMVLVPVFIRVLHFNDFVLGIIGTVSMMVKNYLIAFSARDIYLYYAGLAAGVFNGLTTLSIRAAISKLVDKDEVGRVFSLLATCEAILPMIGTIIVTKIFERTMDTYPNVAYSMTVFWLAVPLVTFMWALKKTRTPIGSLNVQSADIRREKV